MISWSVYGVRELAAAFNKITVIASLYMLPALVTFRKR